MVRMEIKREQIPALDSLFTNANPSNGNMSGYTFGIILYRETACIEHMRRKLCKGHYDLTNKFNWNDFYGVEIHAQYTDPAKPVPALNTKFVAKRELL